MNDSTYGPTLYDNSANDAAAAAGLIGLLIFSAIVLVMAYVLSAIFLGMIFKKAGIESWKAWVPVYNIWTLLKMGDQPGWWALLMLVPFVNIVAIVFYVIAQYNIGLKFGKEGAFVLLAIFLPLVWLIWLAVDKTAVWSGAQAAAGVSPSQPSNPNPPSQPAAM